MKKLLKTLSKIFDTILGNKYIVLAIIIGLCVMYLPAYSCIQSSADERLETYKRQLSGQLTEKEQELQKANHSIGVLKSELLSRDELIERAKREAEEKAAKDFKTAYFSVSRAC